MADNYIQHVVSAGGGASSGSDTAVITGVAAHSCLVGYMFAGGNPGILSMSSSVDGAFTAQAAQQTDSTNGPCGRQFVLQNATAGTHTITGTDANGNTVFFALAEIGSTGAGAVSGSNANFQATPGAGTDAITTGSITVTGAATLVAFGNDTGNVVSTSEPVAGTGFTARFNGNNGCCGSFRLETASVTTNTAGTFTAGATGGAEPGMSFGVAILNTAGGGGGPQLMSQQWN